MPARVWHGSDQMILIKQKKQTIFLGEYSISSNSSLKDLFTYQRKRHKVEKKLLNREQIRDISQRKKSLFRIFLRNFANLFKKTF